MSQDPGSPQATDVPVGRHGMPPGTAAVLALILAVAGVAAVLRTCTGGPQGPKPEDVDLSVPDWRASAEELHAIDAAQAVRRAAAPANPTGPAKALLDAYEAFNLADARHGGVPREPHIGDAHAEYEQWARTATSHLGPEAFMGLGQTVVDRTLTALAAGDSAALERLGGTFIDQARTTGLMDARGKLAPGARPVIMTVFIYRWAQAVSESHRVNPLVSGAERELLLRWKLAANPLLSPARREEVAAELRKLGTAYPVEEALAARAAQDGRWNAAARHYAEAAKAYPDAAARLMANAAYAQARDTAAR